MAVLLSERERAGQHCRGGARGGGGGESSASNARVLFANPRLHAHKAAQLVASNWLAGGLGGVQMPHQDPGNKVDWAPSHRMKSNRSRWSRAASTPLSQKNKIMLRVTLACFRCITWPARKVPPAAARLAAALGSCRVVSWPGLALSLCIHIHPSIHLLHGQIGPLSLIAHFPIHSHAPVAATLACVPPLVHTYMSLYSSYYF